MAQKDLEAACLEKIQRIEWLLSELDKEYVLVLSMREHYDDILQQISRQMSALEKDLNDIRQGQLPLEVG